MESIKQLLLASILTLSASAKKPNIIFLLADDQDLSSVACYGNTDVKTPNMDKLAADGVLFERHYNTTAICMASRANIFTGMYEYKNGTNFEHGNMKPAVWAKTYPVLLREAGYLTAFAGKFGMEVDGRGQNGKPGMCETDFDFWAGGPGQTSFATKANKALAKYAEEFPHATLAYGAFSQNVIRESVKQKKPFCLSISFKAPHKPATPDPRYNDIYAGKKFTKPANFGREHGEHLSPQSKTGRQYARFSEWKYDSDYDVELAKYYQQVYAIDVALGMIREEVEKQGIRENTVIIYTSDNGYLNGAHGYGSKVLPMEESSRVPLMILDPRTPSAGKKWRSGALTGNIDFAPTILELAGLEYPENMDGVSLLPLLQDEKKEVRDTLMLMNAWSNASCTAMSIVVKDRMKYTYWWYGNSEMEPTEELFDLKKDPLELKNFAKDKEYSSELERMRSLYDEQLEHFKNEAVPYNDYQRFGLLFDREIPLSEKEQSMKKEKKRKNKKLKE